MWRDPDIDNTSCAATDLVTNALPLPRMSRVYVQGFAQIRANQPGSAPFAEIKLVVDLMDGNTVTASLDSGDPFVTPANMQLMTVGGVLGDGTTAISIPAGNYQVHFRMLQSEQCSVKTFAYDPTLSVVLLGTDP
jgi:hypothetical protein